MLSILVISFVLAVSVSGFCSLMEASLYAVPASYVNILAKRKKRSGVILKRFKDNVSQPIAAILILNTIANTAGAAICGWAVGGLYGPKALLVFSIFFTLIILYFSEIVPKMVGVVFCKQIAPIIAYPLAMILKIEYPLVMLSEGVGKVIQRKKQGPLLSINELLSMMEIGQNEGTIDELEGALVKNAITLDQVLLKDIATPRVVVFRLDETREIGLIKSEIFDWNFTRVPIYNPNKPELLTGYVTQRDIFRNILKKTDLEKALSAIARPIHTVPELMRADKLLSYFMENGEHIAAVVDEHGSLVGIVTLEDILEELVGREIIDEYDKVGDLRKYAQTRRKK